jgi:hypothetical protein
VPRGKAATIGDRRISQNGYDYTRTPQGWRLTHHLIAEKKLGRPLAEDERVSFQDRDRRNLDPSNILVSRADRGSIRAQIARLEERKREIEGQIADLKDRLNEKDNLLEAAESLT